MRVRLPLGALQEDRELVRMELAFSGSNKRRRKWLKHSWTSRLSSTSEKKFGKKRTNERVRQYGDIGCNGSYKKLYGWLDYDY